jgi:hypothetical protein
LSVLGYKRTVVSCVVRREPRYQQLVLTEKARGVLVVSSAV